MMLTGTIWGEQVEVLWERITDPTDNFIVQRSADVLPRTWVDVATTPSTERRYVDDVVPGNYVWRVITVDNGVRDNPTTFAGGEITPRSATGVNVNQL